MLRKECRCICNFLVTRIVFFFFFFEVWEKHFRRHYIWEKTRIESETNLISEPNNPDHLKNTHYQTLHQQTFFSFPTVSSSSRGSKNDSNTIKDYQEGVRGLHGGHRGHGGHHGENKERVDRGGTLWATFWRGKSRPSSPSIKKQIEALIQRIFYFLYIYFFNYS